MSAKEQIPIGTATEEVKVAERSEKSPLKIADNTTAPIEQERAEKILKAKELYSHGSRNYLVKSYAEAADELSQVCALYEELYGEQADELGMPYLLYAKSLIALALDENKVIDVPDEEELEDDDYGEEGGDEENGEATADAEETKSKNGNGIVASSSWNGATQKSALDSIKEKAEADSTETEAEVAAAAATTKPVEEKATKADETIATASASSTAEDDKNVKENGKGKGEKNGAADMSVVDTKLVLDDEKPSTSNGDGDAGEEDDEEENEAASNLQLAWEILELAAKIFLRQGTNGLPNLAEVQTELANIEFENNLPEAAREDYVRALKIYRELPTNYRRAMAEIHYKIGLTYLMQQLNKEGAESLKDACTLIDAEIKDLQEGEEELSEKQKNNIQDMEETKQEIWAKISEIEDTQAQNMAEVRAALDSYIKPNNAEHKNDAEASSSSSAKAAVGASSSADSSAAKPTDISHLIKRKKPDEQECEADSTASPAKRPAV
ncbi:protein NASP homolog [Eurosta solidaginis]|uniref:protein NASP homolog n=1 Tax=Eurosta solidaginis TaxID=178769 RepID=UPI003530DCB2